MTKVCTKCRAEKPSSAFYRVRKGEPQLRPLCKPCSHEARRATPSYGPRRRYDQELTKDPLYHVKKRLRYKYNLTLDEYEGMVAAQGGCCAICREPESSSSKRLLSVDHCHATGKVRGLLCDQCNNMLGRARDDVEVLRSAIRYLEASWD